MTHLEGPVVNAFYDMWLNSWHKVLEPLAPTLNIHADPIVPRPSSLDQSDDKSSSSPITEVGMTSFPKGVFHQSGSEDLAKETSYPSAETLPEHTAKDPHYDVDIASEVLRAQSVLEKRGKESRINAVTRHLSTYSNYLRMS